MHQPTALSQKCHYRVPKIGYFLDNQRKGEVDSILVSSSIPDSTMHTRFLQVILTESGRDVSPQGIAISEFPTILLSFVCALSISLSSLSGDRFDIASRLSAAESR